MSHQSEVARPSLLVRLSEPMVLIFLILMATYVASFIIPAGEFVRETIDGKTMVKPGSFRYLTDVPAIHFFDVFIAIPKGLIKASQYLFIVFIAGGLFHVLQGTGALETGIGVSVRKIGVEHKNIVITIGTFIYGFFGVAVGFENNIALVPVATLISWLLFALVGTAWLWVGSGLACSLSTIPWLKTLLKDTFSGAGLRIVLVIAGLALLSVYLCKKVTKMEYTQTTRT